MTLLFFCVRRNTFCCNPRFFPLSVKKLTQVVYVWVQRHFLLWVQMKIKIG